MARKQRPKIRLRFRHGSPLLKIALIVTLVICTVSLLTLHNAITRVEAETELLRQQAARLERENHDLAKNIAEVGSFEVIEIAEIALKKWIENWKSRGLGWMAEPIGKGSNEGFVSVMNYYGSSAYDTAEMSRLIDSLVSEAKSLGIETLTPNELERLKTAWKG